MRSPGRSEPYQKFYHVIKSKTFAVLLTVSILSISIWQIAELTEKRTLDQLASTGELRLNLYATTLRNTMEKHRHLPYVLARNDKIIDLLQNNIPAIRVNPHLEDFARASGALIYVLDQGGTTVATSNWRTPQSLLGHNYSFRPYFTDARSGQTGGYYAVGLQTRQPGFFLSYPVKDKGSFLGVIVVKINLEAMQETWKKSGEAVIVSDAFGVIFLTSNQEWKYTSLRELPDHTTQRLQAVKYLNLPLPTLQLERHSVRNYNILQLDTTRYLENALQLPEYGWRIHYLSSLEAVKNNKALAIIVATILSSFLLLTFLYIRERRQKLISRQEAKRAQAVGEINERLRLEIAKHQLTENDLRQTQRELVQADKLAALGRMSAAIAHELNQPVTAIRTFVASCRILLERNEVDKVNENLDFIAGLTDRMGKITGQLKTFARKRKGKVVTIELGALIYNVVRQLEPQCSKAGVALSTEVDRNCRVSIRGDSLQLEQVLSNLLHNSLDAVQQASSKTIKVLLQTTNEKAILTVSDSGAGISDEVMDSLFDPFFTTKEIGKGLGLGLSIAYGIVEDMDGSIRAENLQAGGAQFIVELPQAGQE